MKMITKPFLWVRPLFLRSEMDRMLSLSMTFSVLMVLARITYSGERDYLFLVWNLFLAYIPYFISNLLQHTLSWIEHRGKFTLAFVVWLLFVPNTFYILTDFFHLSHHDGAPLWYDLTLIVSFAWNGLLLGILSVRQMEKIMHFFIPGKTAWLFLYPVMILNALGVYIGRYMRFNSWDVVTNPLGLAADIIRMILHPVAHKEAWAMVTCFSAFMILVYLSLKKISKLIW